MNRLLATKVDLELMRADFTKIPLRFDVLEERVSGHLRAFQAQMAAIEARLTLKISAAVVALLTLFKVVDHFFLK
jgi:hypothetical protein